MINLHLEKIKSDIFAEHYKPVIEHLAELMHYFVQTPRISNERIVRIKEMFEEVVEKYIVDFSPQTDPDKMEFWNHSFDIKNLLREIVAEIEWQEDLNAFTVDFFDPEKTYEVRAGLKRWNATEFWDDPQRSQTSGTQTPRPRKKTTSETNSGSADDIAKQRYKEDLDAWDKTRQDDTIGAYEQYILSFPEGKFKNEAILKIEAIERAEREKQQAINAQQHEPQLNRLEKEHQHQQQQATVDNSNKAKFEHLKELAIKFEKAGKRNDAIKAYEAALAVYWDADVYAMLQKLKQKKKGGSKGLVFFVLLVVGSIVAYNVYNTYTQNQVVTDEAWSWWYDLSPEWKDVLRSNEYVYDYPEREDLYKLLISTYLTCSNDTITDITPLQLFKNVETLTLNMRSVTDLSPISGMSQLTTLDISRSGATSISALYGLYKLEYLYIRAGQIPDAEISILAQYLPSCTPVVEDVPDFESVPEAVETETIEIEENTPLADSTAY